MLNGFTTFAGSTIPRIRTDLTESGLTSQLTNRFPIKPKHTANDFNYYYHFLHIVAGCLFV